MPEVFETSKGPEEMAVPSGVERWGAQNRPARASVIPPCAFGLTPATTSA